VAFRRFVRTFYHDKLAKLDYQFMSFNEDTRVKIPAILHLCKLGYTFLPLSKATFDNKTNIAIDIFTERILRINSHLKIYDIKKILDELTLVLDYDDLGKTFYSMLTATSGIKLIDFDNFNTNSFHVVTELPCINEEEEFRPDITLLINGMPLVFIEVKVPNNKEGILAERKRMNTRFANKKFRRFANITQLMVFSNNMPYEDGVIEPLMGAYYATSTYKDIMFNYFREEKEDIFHNLLPDDEEIENLVLKTTNYVTVKHSPEFASSKNPLNPTNKILSSLMSKERLAFILKYAIAYVNESNALEKHVMRYPQLFATKAIEHELNNGIKKGVIWHTQGSGKTALAFYNVKFLTDYFQQKNVIPKFYFIVDRIDLADQAKTEFTNRGLIPKVISSRIDFINDLKKVSALSNHSGKSEITIVNIQKFTENSLINEINDYDLHIQRIYFIDEAHRSYNPKGLSLTNLYNSDPKAIKIALTGTPLLKEVAKEYDTKALFGKYIHKYYYNQSIADGYTLRLIREDIETTYKMQMQEILEQIHVLQKDITKEDVYAHRKYIEPLLEYIVADLQKFQLNDPSVGGMVVCDSSKQAKALFAAFEKKYGHQYTDQLSMAADPGEPYGTAPHTPTASLILHDVHDKKTREDIVKAYKAGKIDLLFVYQMLLTGFDAKRLKKLYLNRVIKNHGLLQTLTRVNRTYKQHNYGYVVDFADIQASFDKTNQLYFDELQEELGDEMQQYSNMFKSKEEIKADIEHIKEQLFQFDTQNATLFDEQINQIKDKKQLIEIIKALRTASELKNIIRMGDDQELLKLLDFYKMKQLLGLAQKRLDGLNLIDAINNSTENANLLNEALEDIWFSFVKVGEAEMILADAAKNQMQRTREALERNMDTKDPQFISLKEALENVFRKKNLGDMAQVEIEENIALLQDIYAQAAELNRKNALLKAKYESDEKYARVHKRLMENGLQAKESQLHEALMETKQKADDTILHNAQIIDNEEYFKNELMQYTIQAFVHKQQMKLDFNTIQAINTLIANEYLQQHHYNRR
jgi:type I restriction enzyme R subunit